MYSVCVCVCVCSQGQCVLCLSMLWFVVSSYFFVFSYYFLISIINSCSDKLEKLRGT